MSILSQGLKNTAAQAVKGVFIFLLGVTLARFLGPELFGVFSVLGVISLQIWGILDSGLQRAFFYHTSYESQPKSFYSLYLIIIFAQFVLGSLLVALLNSTLDIYKTAAEFFDFGLVLLVFIGLMTQKSILNTATMLADLSRRSWIGNIAEACSYGTHWILLLWLMQQPYSQDILITFLLFQCVTNVLFAIFLASKFYPKLNSECKDLFFDHARRLLAYCRPLIPYLMVGSVIITIEQIILVTFGNEEQAGFYAIVVRLGLICILITSGFLNIISREISALSADERVEEVTGLVTAGVELVFLASAIIAGFFFFFAKEVVLFIYGADYLDAYLVQIFYSLYIPIQAVGQLVAVCYFALARTRLYAISQMTAQIVGLILFYVTVKFFSDEIGGRADVALSIKFLLIYTISHGYCFIRLLGWQNGASSLMRIAVVTLGIFLTGLILKTTSGLFVDTGLSLFSFLVIQGFIYLSVVGLVVYALDLLFSGHIFRKSLHRLLSN